MTSQNRFSTDMTVWFPPNTAPLLVGEYNASKYCVHWMRRWWNGAAWSTFYSEGQAIPKTLASDAEQWQIWWRGLIKDPAAPKEAHRPKLMWTQPGGDNGPY